jgi:hypothetical protein
MSIVLNGEERAEVDENADRVVVIDTTPIGTLDFRLSLVEKDFLLKVGRAAALRFIQARNIDDGPSESEVEEAVSLAEAARSTVVSQRRESRRRSVTRLMIIATVLALAALAICLFRLM